MIAQAVLLSVIRLSLAADGREIPNWSAPETWTPARSATTQAVQAASDPLPFVAVAPCRGADTRGGGFTGQYGPPSLGGNSTRTFTIAGTCGVPASAAAVSLNFTVTNNPTFGDIRVFPAGGGVLVSTLNWGPGTGNVANAAVVQLSASGAISVQVDGPGPLDLIYDINGYYAPAPGTGLVDGSRRAVMEQFWTTQNPINLGFRAVGTSPTLVKSDGADLWVASSTSGTVSRVRASDGKLLDTWTGATQATGMLVAMGAVFTAGGASRSPGKLFRLDPSLPATVVTTLASNVGEAPVGIAFDGKRIWTANAGGSLTLLTPSATVPWPVVTVTTGVPGGILFDGANIWITDTTANTLVKLDDAGGVVRTVAVGTGPGIPIFDGANIWVPNSANSVTVVRASSGAVVTTLTGNGLNAPHGAAFDGQRVLITNPAGDSVSLWRAADLTPLGSFPTGVGTRPFGACSDGVNFWIVLASSGQLARF